MLMLIRSTVGHLEVENSLFPPGNKAVSIFWHWMLSDDTASGSIRLGIIKNMDQAVGILALAQSIAVA